MGMGNLQRMAMQMQQEMERVQAELAEAEVEGSAGGGVVRAVVTGKQSLVSITIDPSAVDAMTLVTSVDGSDGTVIGSGSKYRQARSAGSVTVDQFAA